MIDFQTYCTGIPRSGLRDERKEKGESQGLGKGGARNPASWRETTFAVVLRMQRSGPTGWLNDGHLHTIFSCSSTEVGLHDLVLFRVYGQIGTVH